MRIVAGIYGGRKLSVPKGRDIRPTSDKIRGALMNMLEARGAIMDAHVLDAFCGSGALGLEALSRGAAASVFMDSSPASLALARDNASALGVVATFWQKDALRLGAKAPTAPPFTLVFLDPPYGKNMARDMLGVLQRGGWLAPGAWVVCEEEKKAPTLDAVADFSLESEKTYGETKIHLLKFCP